MFQRNIEIDRNILKSVPEHYWLFALCLFAFLAKLLFFVMVRQDPTFTMPIIDPLEFDVWGYKISKGELLWPQITNHPPLYAYFLGLVYFILGYSPANAVLVQYVLASLSLFWLFKIIRHYFDAPTAWVCCFLASTYWFIIYVNSFLFSENLSIVLNILLVYILTIIREGWKKYLTAGFVLALTEVCRPQMFPFALGILVLIFIQSIPLKRKFVYVFLFLITTLVLNGLVIYQNYRVSGEALLRTQIGANIYMGNDPAFQGTNLYVKIGRDWDKFISSPHHHYQQQVGEADSNKYFMSKTMDIIRTRPLEWGGLIAAKAFSIVTGREFLRSEDVYAYNFYVIKTPFCLISTKLIFLLAFMGVCLSIYRRRKIWAMYILLMTFIPMFFFPIKTRYLMGLMPFVLAFSAYVIVGFYHMYKDKEFKTLGLNLFLLGVLVLMSFCNPLRLTLPDVSEAFYAIARNFDARRNMVMAERYYLASIQIDPGNLSAYNELGVLYLNQKRCGQAIGYFKKAIELDPEAVYPKMNLELCQKDLSHSRSTP